jgi:hypothetical protein
MPIPIYQTSAVNPRSFVLTENEPEQEVYVVSGGVMLSVWANGAFGGATLQFQAKGQSGDYVPVTPANTAGAPVGEVTAPQHLTIIAPTGKLLLGLLNPTENTSVEIEIHPITLLSGQ